jgi:hypothetical protein
MRKPLLVFSILLAAIAFVALAVAAKPVRGVYVARVAGTQAFVAVAVGHGKARAYLCDSRRLGIWLPLGQLRGKYVELSNSQVRLTGSVGRQDVQGTVTLADGSPHTFDALLAPGKGAAGLYRAVKTVHGTRYVAGWIVDLSGAQRGDVLATTVEEGASNTVVETAPRFNPKDVSVDIAGAGEVTARKVVIVF